MVGDELAKDLSLKQLQGILAGNTDRFESLNWVGVEENILVKLFPYVKKYGKTYLTSAERVREWRKIGKGDQQYKIDQAEEQQGKGAKKTSRRRRAGGRASAEEEHHDDVPAKDDRQQQYASPPNKVSTAKKRRVDREEGGGGDVNEVDRLVPGGEGVSSPPLLHQPTDPLEVEHEETITLHYLPKHPGHTINQMHLGSDPCETTFNLSRNANPNASKKDTDHIMAGLHGGIISNLAASRNGNVGQKTTYYSNELDVGKIKRESKSKRRKSKSKSRKRKSKRRK